MFIKTFEDVRKYIIEHTHIDLMVDYGLDRVNLFGTDILLDAAWYVLSKKQDETDGIYFNITANQQEKAKQSSLEVAYHDAINLRKNDRVYSLIQSKLKIIESWPFIYWISDGFREKFKGKPISDYATICKGLTTSNNERFLRYHWEVKNHEKWFPFVKGGPYNKWFGNLWLTVNWGNDGFDIKNFKDNKGNPRAVVRNSKYYFKKGITGSFSGSKGVTFRYLPENYIIEGASGGIFFDKSYDNIIYTIGFLNSKLSFYIVDCLNPTVTTEVGDLQRIPFIKPPQLLEDNVSALAVENIEIKKPLNSFRIVETNFMKVPQYWLILMLH
jgi:hypothetical protein